MSINIKVKKLECRIEDLSSQVDYLKRYLDSNSALYKEIDIRFTRILQTLGKPNEIAMLCQLHQLLNDELSVQALNSRKKRKSLEELNVIILTLIQQRLKAIYKLEPPKAHNKNKKVPFYKKGIFYVIAGICILFAAIDGASVVQTIAVSLSVFWSIPALVVLPLQIFVAGLAILTFCAFQLNSIGKPLGIRAFELSKLFKLYNQESILYENIFSMVRSAATLNDLDSYELESLNNNYENLKVSYEIFQTKINEAQHLQAHPSLVKTAVLRSCTCLGAVVCGVMGALMAQDFIASLLPFAIGATLASGPVGMGITIGIMSVFFITSAAIYIYFERRAISELVNKIWGTPSKTTDKLIARDSTITEHQRSINQGIQNGKRLQAYQAELAARSYDFRHNQEQPDTFLKWRAAKGASPISSSSDFNLGQQPETRVHDHPENRIAKTGIHAY